MRVLLLIVMVACLVLIGGCAGTSDMMDNPDAEVHFNMGVSYLKEPNPAQALKSFLDAEKLAPRDPKIHDALAQAYMLKMAYDKAEERFKLAIELSDNDPKYLNNLAAMYLSQERYDEAIDYFDRAAQDLMFDQPELAYVGKGYAHFKKHDYLDAVTAYSRALEFNPRYALGHFRLGEAYYELGKTSLAKQSYNRALELAPNSAVIHYRKGIAEVKLRQISDAQKSFRQVVKLDPEGEYGRQAADYLKILK